MWGLIPRLAGTAFAVVSVLPIGTDRQRYMAEMSDALEGMANAYEQVPPWPELSPATCSEGSSVGSDCVELTSVDSQSSEEGRSQGLW